MYIYIDEFGVLSASQSSLNAVTLACSSGCTLNNSLTGFPPRSLPLYTWTVTNGAWDLTGGIDRRAMLSTGRRFVAGPNISITEDGDSVSIGLISSGGTSYTFSAPLSEVAGTVSLPAASGSQNGFLSSTNFNRLVFNDGTYNNPSWLTGLDWTKLSGVPSTFTPSSHTHSTADITSGSPFPVVRGGTGANLSATGGAGQYVKQSTVGGAFSVGAIAVGDVPTLNQNTTGNAGTATALAADPANCTSGQLPRGVDASGAAQGCGAVNLATEVTGPLPIGNGGTGQTTATAALTALLPAQTGQSGKALVTNGTSASWQTVAGGGGSSSPDALYFGEGDDGDVTCNGASTLSKDMYYNNLTVQSGCAITAHGYRVFVKGTLDITAAPAGWLIVSGANGNNASGATGGTVGTGATSNAIAGVSVGSRVQGTVGANGVTGVGAQAANNANGFGNNGGSSGAGGAGGTGSSGAGGASRAAFAISGPRLVFSFQPQLLTMQTATLAHLQGGSGAPGGSSGAGDGTTAGGGGGGGASGGGVIWLSARTISRGGSTAANGIQAGGGNGGNGGARTTGNVGGGGGGAGAGGGYVLIYYWALSGSTATDLIDASGGTGGNGGSGFGTGAAGNGGGGGNCGRITLIDLQANTATTTGGGTGSAASGQTGGAGCVVLTSL
ncbi:hypothetical protein F183_A55200 (plasmid) [Bryobacterales bacterium F-183]|nr:hypothetical protein F183_A55200 [Bryobacterales bacterium F-183]